MHAAGAGTGFSGRKAAPFFWVGFILLLAVVVLLPATPSIYRTPDVDTSIFLFIGNKIRQGQLPFRDWYDHKPPLIFYLNALGMWLGNGSRWGVWAVELLSLTSASLCGFVFLRRYYGAFLAALAVAATLLNLTFVFQRGNLTEEYALPFQFAAMLLLSDIALGKRPDGRLFAIGCMLAMASSLKQPLAGIGISIAAFITIFFGSQGRWRALLSSFAWILAGVVAVWAAWFLYFALAGIFPEFWEAAFSYNVALAGIPPEKRVQALFAAFGQLFHWSGYFLAGMLAWLAVLPYLFLRDARFAWMLTSRAMGMLFAAAGLFLTAAGVMRLPLLILPGVLLATAGGGIATGWARRRIAHRIQGDAGSACSPLLLPLVILLVDLPVAMAFSSLSGNNFAHYFVALLPSLTLAIAFLGSAVLELAGQSMGRFLAYAWLLVLMVPVLGPGIVDTAIRMGPRGDRQIEAVVSYVIAQTQPGDYVFSWGTVPAVNLLSGRDAPSRYFFLDPLFVDGYSGRAQTGELLHDLRAKSPTLIIDEKLARLPLVQPASPDQCAELRDPQIYLHYAEAWKEQGVDHLPQIPSGMDEVYFWICQNYIPAGPVGELGWQVYRWKGK